jgi:SAM-dependent methyltransferase
MKSYVNVPLKGWQRLRELRTLYAFRRRMQSDEARNLVQGVTEHVTRIEGLLGEPLRDKRILEVGPGQLLKRARIFAVGNEVTGIDLDDLPADGLSGLLQTWRVNGAVRALKTLGRRALGLDRRFLQSLHEILPATRDVKVGFKRCDATSTGFPSAVFDVTVSNSVLEHIPDPTALVQEMIRITRPGGVFSHIVHLYTSDTGAHDPRSYVGEHRELPHWAHLRSDCRHLATPNCYLNEWRMRAWMDLFQATMPGVQIEFVPREPSPTMTQALADLRRKGQLQDYSDTELVTDCLIVSWRKP